MKVKTLVPRSTPPWAPARHLAAVLGVMAGAAVVAVVAVLFDNASSMPWLQPTDANTALLAPCGQLHQGTAARRHCVETVVAAAQARASEATVAAVPEDMAPTVQRNQP